MRANYAGILAEPRITDGPDYASRALAHDGGLKQKISLKDPDGATQRKVETADPNKFFSVITHKYKGTGRTK